MGERIDFEACLMECVKQPGFIQEFNRLTGCRFGQSLTRKPIERMIDDACGHSGESDDDTRLFIAFVYEFVWSRLPEEAFEKS